MIFCYKIAVADCFICCSSTVLRNNLSAKSFLEEYRKSVIGD